MQTQNLQIIPRGVKPIIKASQFDVGREFELKLYDGAMAYTPPAGTTLRLDGVKPDGTVFSYTENLSLSGSTITVTTTTQMTILEGTVQCEIRMTKDNDDIGTINFDLMVEKSPINETTDLSQTEIPALVTLARMQMENAEAWAVGTKDGEPVSPDDPQYENSAKYWAQQVGGETQDAEAWAVGTKDGVPVTSGDPQYHNNAKYYSDGVHTDAQAAAASALVSEGYATGKQNGTDVASTSPYYHNNAAYFAGEAADAATTAANAALRAEAAVVLEPYIGANGNWYVYDFSTNAYVDTGVDATGATGNGIASIAKTSTSGLVDTYTITYTDNTTTTFTVTNGADGQNGQDGATGNGIASITKTSTSGLVDTYTILYTDGTSTTFTVTNGQNGTGAGDMLAADYDPTQAVYNEGGIAAYVAAQLSGFSTSLSGLSDVALASLATGQSLVYDATSGKWVNGSVSYSNLTNKPTFGTAAAKDSTNAVTNASTDLVESGAVYTELGTKVNKTDIAPVEDTSTASRQYVAGEQFYFNGVLKEATATIAQGGTITPGTNCSDAPKVTAEIQTLTQNKLTTGVLDLTAMAEYSNDLLLVPNGLWFIRAAVMSSGSILNKPPVNIGGILISRDNPAPGNQFEFLPFESIYPRYHWNGLHTTASEVGGWKPMMQSNPNLLDNPFFTVNQRGANQYTASTEARVFTVDRWATASGATGGNTTVDVVTNGVNLTTASDVSDNATLTQHLNDNSLFGKTVVISAIIDGVSYIATGIVPSAKTSSWQQVCRTEINGVSIAFLVAPSTDTAFQFEFIIRTPKDNNAYNVRAAKLEIGEVSTLAQDTAPNYATELTKCQRYFLRLHPIYNSKYAGIGTGIVVSDTEIRLFVPMPANFRSAPAISFNLDTNKIKVFAGNLSNQKVVTNIAINQYATTNTVLTLTTESLSGVLSQGDYCECWFMNTTDGFIDFSADL